MNSSINAADISAAYERIRRDIVATPVNHSRTFSALCGCTTLLKLENLQMTGSFKERGALNRLLALSAEERQRGVIAASAGNHAQAVAYHGQRLGIDTRIVMPIRSPLVKVRSTEHWGAEVILAGETFDDAYNRSQEMVAEEGRVYLHPFDDPLVIAGQGTVALEIMADPLCQDLDAILVPVGGGGLIAGVAHYIKEKHPAVRVIGVEEASCDAMKQSLLAGAGYIHAAAPVLADGIAVRQVSPTNLDTVRERVDDMVTVSSDEVANAIMLMLEIEKMVIEGAAAAPLAALVNHKVPSLAGGKVLALISGGNIDVNLLSRIIQQGMTFDGRIARIESTVLDRPGALEEMLTVFREVGANVLEIQHQRLSTTAPIGRIDVTITLETRDSGHIERIQQTLKDRGYSLRD